MSSEHEMSNAAVAQIHCRHLRSKGMYITGQLNPAAEGNEVGDGHCWCNQTQHALGPDDDFVGRDTCIAGRQCFVQIL